MATAVISLTEFSPEDNHDVESYMERFELYFEANDTTEEKKAAIFLCAIGQKAYSILCQSCNCSPSQLRQKSFAAIAKLFKECFAEAMQPLYKGKRLAYYLRLG